MDKFSSSRYFSRAISSQFHPLIDILYNGMKPFSILAVFLSLKFLFTAVVLFSQHGKFHYFKNIFTEVQLIHSVVRFRVYSKVVQLCISIYLSIQDSFHYPGYYKVLSIVSNVYGSPYWILFLCVLVFYTN